jgi:primosomal protein N'
MIAQVSPLRRLPTGLDVFDYQLTEAQAQQAHVGQLVTIPFKQQSLAGVIVKLQATTTESTIKSIGSFLPSSITEHQVTLALWLADYYHLSLATILALFVPTIAKRGLVKQPAVRSLEPFPFTLSTIPAAKLQGWLVYQSWSALFSYVQTIIKKSSSGQTVFICPEIYQQKLIQQLLEKLGLPQETIWLPSKVQKNSYAQAWHESQHKKYVIGGFQALWLPFKKLHQAIIIEADNLQFHRAEQSPRIHLADVLVRWQETYQTKLLVTTVSPNVGLYQALTPLNLPPITVRAKPEPSRTLIDMRQERQVKNFDFLSEAAKTAVESAHGPVLLYLNNHGSETLVSCQRCHWFAPCPTCNKALTFNRSTQELECLSCGHHQTPIQRCASCGSEQLKLTASGQKKLERELKKQYPEKTIVLAKSGTPLPQLTDQTIVIATSMIASTLYHWHHTIMVQADSDLQRPDFQATDQLRRTIFKLLQSCDHLLIQTYNPEHYIFTTLDSYSEFLEHELAFRRDFHYPPLTPSYKIIFRRGILTAKDTTYDQVLTFLQAELPASASRLVYPKHIIIRGVIPATFIDKLYKKFNNKLIVEINPYQWL